MFLYQGTTLVGWEPSASAGGSDASASRKESPPRRALAPEVCFPPLAVGVFPSRLVQIRFFNSVHPPPLMPKLRAAASLPRRLGTLISGAYTGVEPKRRGPSSWPASGPSGRRGSPWCRMWPRPTSNCAAWKRSWRSPGAPSRPGRTLCNGHSHWRNMAPAPWPTPARHKAQANLPELRRQIAVQENTISILLGHNPEDIHRGLDVASQPHPQQVPTGVPSRLLQSGRKPR